MYFQILIFGSHWSENHNSSTLEEIFPQRKYTPYEMIYANYDLGQCWQCAAGNMTEKRKGMKGHFYNLPL